MPTKFRGLSRKGDAGFPIVLAHTYTHTPVKPTRPCTCTIETMVVSAGYARCSLRVLFLEFYHSESSRILRRTFYDDPYSPWWGWHFFFIIMINFLLKPRGARLDKIFKTQSSTQLDATSDALGVITVASQYITDCWSIRIRSFWFYLTSRQLQASFFT